jgi:hypothetical protein
VKITVRVAVDTGDDTTEPVETQVLALSRDELTPDTLGLHLAETHELLAALQEALVNAQVSPARSTNIDTAPSATQRFGARTSRRSASPPCSVWWPWTARAIAAVPAGCARWRRSAR